MVMKPRTIVTSGWCFQHDASGEHDVLVQAHRDELSGITSNSQPVPYVTALGQHYVKSEVAMHGNGYSYYKASSGAIPVTVSGFPPSNIYSWMWLWDGTTAAQNTESYNKAVADLGDKIRGNLDVSIDLAQYSKTRQIGRDCAKVVLSLLKARNPIAIIKAIGSARLTWVYGVKPTLQSIYDCVQFEAKHYLDVYRPFIGRGTSLVKLINKDGGGGWPDYTYWTAYDAFCSVRDEIGVVMRIPDSPLTSLARLTSLNPVSIAWELMPFSFVVDWFVNIGGYVRDLETAVTYNSYFTRGYRTTTRRIQMWYRAGRKSGGGWPQYSGSWTFNMTRAEKSRTMLTGYPFPEIPKFSPNLGSGRLFNAAALLSNFLSNPKAKGAKAVAKDNFYNSGRKNSWSLDPRLTP